MKPVRYADESRQAPFAEALIESLVAWCRAGGQPTEMVLPQKLYLALALELDIDDPAALPRIVFDSPPISFVPAQTPMPMPTLTSHRVRVGPSFVFFGPGGPVTIREAP